MAKKIIKKNSSQVNKPQYSEDIPVSMRLLNLVKQELKSDNATLRLDVKAGFASVQTQFAQIDARFATVDAQFAEIRNQLTKMMVVLEEQNHRNNVALEGYTIVYEKLMESDTRFQKIEKHCFGID